MSELSAGNFENEVKLLEVEVETFEELLPQLLETNPGDWSLIKGKSLGGVFPEEREAVDKGYELFGPGPFLVRRILEEQPVVRLPLRLQLVEVEDFPA